MKRRILTAGIIGMLAGSLWACGSPSQETEQTESSMAAEELQETGEAVVERNDAPAAEAAPEEETGASNVLIAYFSLYGNSEDFGEADTNASASIVVNGDKISGTTETIGAMIQEQTGGDLFPIHSETVYPGDFQEVVDQNHEELDAGYRPALTEQVENMDQYDTVFIGYPIWAVSMPAPVQAFLEAYDWTGKTVIPFCTHDGYGSGTTFDDIGIMCQGSRVLEGLAVEAEDVPAAGDMVSTWIQGLGIGTSQDELPAENIQEETPISIRIGDLVLDGVLNNTPEALQFMDMLPVTISMSGFGGREYYGGIDGSISVEGQGQLNFDNGDITYCPTNNTAAIFYAQTDRPDLTMEVFPMGRVTSDLSVFDTLGDQVEITFELLH